MKTQKTHLRFNRRLLTETLCKYPTDVGEIEQHFDAFLKTTRRHYDFCRQERERRSLEKSTIASKTDERIATRRYLFEEQARATREVKEIAESRGAKSETTKLTEKVPHVGSGNGMTYVAGAVIFGLLGIIFWPLLIVAGIFLFLFFFSGVFNFDPIEDGKKVEGFGVLDGLPIGCAIPLVLIAIVLFAVVMAGKK